MSRIAIITDTDSGLPQGLAEKYGITQVPIIIQFGEDSYKDLYDITNEELFARIDKDKKLPTTAAPAPGQFADAFNKAVQTGADEILCLNISSEMSATYASARQAAELLPEHRITVMDTRVLSFGQGYMVLAAAEAVSQGASLAEAVQQAEDIRDRTYLFGALSTLKYIAMSGRVSQLAAGMAGFLDIKPILTAQNGKLELLEKIRTQGKSWNRVVELCSEKASGKKIEKMSVLNVSAREDAKKLEILLRAAIPCPDEIIQADVNPGLAVHTGAGMVAVAFVLEKE